MKEVQGCFSGHSIGHIDEEYANRKWELGAC